MQIDFHHAVTYVVARLAGFDQAKADTIAYCAQYVDDATNSGLIRFDNNAMYSRISSAHRMLDYRNFDALANHHVWLPFHFLPGNGGLEAGRNPDGSFIEKIICRPNSPVAQDMVRACIEDADAAYGLHRLGVTMHVYADTWAHQGFAGVNHKVNDIRTLDDADEPDAGLFARLRDYFGDKFDQAAGKFVGDAMPLGHGAVLSYPDRPWLKWRYRNHNGRVTERNNTQDFIEAADAMCKAMRRFRLGDAEAAVDGLPAGDKEKIEGLLRDIRDNSGDDRHGAWMQRIADGHFSFGAETITYPGRGTTRGKGQGSWKEKALGTRRASDTGDEVFPYRPEFLTSDWKLFHDAIQAHRFAIIHDILPRYGICAA